MSDDFLQLSMEQELVDPTSFFPEPKYLQFHLEHLGFVFGPVLIKTLQLDTEYFNDVSIRQYNVETHGQIKTITCQYSSLDLYSKEQDNGNLQDGVLMPPNDDNVDHHQEAVVYAPPTPSVISSQSQFLLESPEQPPPNQRQQNISCQRCQKMKKKCNDGQPCERCNKAGKLCSLGSDKRRRPQQPSPETVDAKEQRKRPRKSTPEAANYPAQVHSQVYPQVHPQAHPQAHPQVHPQTIQPPEDWRTELEPLFKLFKSQDFDQIIREIETSPKFEDDILEGRDPFPSFDTNGADSYHTFRTFLFNTILNSEPWTKIARVPLDTTDPLAGVIYALRRLFYTGEQGGARIRTPLIHHQPSRLSKRPISHLPLPGDSSPVPAIIQVLDAAMKRLHWILHALHKRAPH